ncbi:MAG: hypothetical protein KAJ19_10325 [Gammaproteobacteria bacterium]|nr:hypothetical protein [Gammaproteobacteria bacterium]
MRKHVMAMTYPPKIEPVQDGRCRQTIRKVGKRTISGGDSILFHGWSEKPYRSKWSWQKRVTVVDVIPILVYETYFQRVGNPLMPAWDGKYGDILARKDFINPPTGIALRDVLFKLNGGKAPNEPEKYNIIRWNL